MISVFSSSRKIMAAPAIKRLQQDWKRLKVDPIVGAMAQPASDKDLMVWHAIVVGAGDSLLAGIPIRFCLEFSNDYPNAAPNGFFETEIYYENGVQMKDAKGRTAVCLSIFGNFAHYHTEWKTEAHGWSPAYTVSTILVSMQGLVMGNMFSNRPSDIERMISSALKFRCSKTGHYGSDQSKWFPQVITDPMIAAAVREKYKKENPGANTPLETFYICYANGQLNANNSTIGYGVHIKNPNNGMLSSPCEYLSKGSFVEGNIRYSSTNQPFEHWLPILVQNKDWTGPKNIKKQFLSAVGAICSDIKFYKDERQKVFKVCSSLMNNLVVEIMENKDNATANDKFINGYFAIYRLLKQYAEEYKQLTSYCDDSLNIFKQQSNARTKAFVPNLGEFLMNLTVSSKFTWKDICKVFMSECEARNVFWYAVGTRANPAPHPELVNPRYVGNRVSKVFNATTVSRNLVMFQIKFANVTKFLDDAELNSNYGLAPEILTAELKNLYGRVIAVKNWDEFYEFIDMNRVDSGIREKELIEAVKLSAARGYHKIYR